MKTSRASYLLWTIAFLILSLPILPLFGDSLADYPNRNDARLIVWILDWVWYALLHAPVLIADGPINYPAPAQLTSSDWFYSAQAAFGPIHAGTGNPVLAANLTAWLTYPLAGFCMERLARRAGERRLSGHCRRAPFSPLPRVGCLLISIFCRTPISSCHWSHWQS